MKCYLTKLIYLSAFFIVIIILAIVMPVISFQLKDWRIDSGKTIAFMGASHISRDLDLSSSLDAINLAKPSERYMFTFMKLKKLVENNPQIKQIVLQCAPTDLWQHTDDKYFVENEMSEFVPLFYPMFTKEDLSFFEGYYDDMAKFILQHCLDPRSYFQSTYFHRIGYGDQDGQMLDDVMDKSKVKPNMIQGTFSNKVNKYYLRKIIDYCKAHNVTLSLIYCPMYKPEYYYDQKYYYSQLKNFCDVPFYDYCNWEVPDSCRYDAHHLNRKGAQLFTKELMRKFNFK